MTPETPPGSLGRCWLPSECECPKVSLTSTTANSPAPAYPPNPELAWAEELDLSRSGGQPTERDVVWDRTRACKGTGRRESCPRPVP